MMDFELEYLRRYDALCKAEGRKGGLPVNVIKVDYNRVDYERIIDIVRSGVTRSRDVAAAFNMGRSAMSYHMAILARQGKLEFRSNKWRIKE